jgi:2-keto-4-pentenoate hydratase/2-oxohepta-3-ene-1,7-dioic acid hydratase in catechol pathway
LTECELAVVIGAPADGATGDEAAAAIAGFTVLNDLTARDWQFRTREWLQSKIWDSTTPVGPYLVTPDELPGGVPPALSTRLTVDGVEKQSANTATPGHGFQSPRSDPVNVVASSAALSAAQTPSQCSAAGTPARAVPGR